MIALIIVVVLVVATGALIRYYDPCLLYTSDAADE